MASRAQSAWSAVAAPSARRARAALMGLLALSALAVISAWPSRAAAEEEVRIALHADKTSLDIGGKSLAIYEGESGHLLFAFSAEGSAQLVGGSGGVGLVIKGAKGAPKPETRHRRVMLEARGGVRVGKGIFLGRIEVTPQKNGKLLVINRLPLETYLLGIVGSEMSPEWPIEALKSQAVAARTYAMQRRMMMRAANRPYDLESTVLSQVYKGADRLRPSVIRAVKETRGEVLAFDYGLAEALFHSTCGGKTCSAKQVFGRAVPYLESRPCSWCRSSTRHRWSMSVPLGQVSRALERARLARGVERFERPEGAPTVTVKEKKGRRNVSPKDVRQAMGYTVLYSERFTAETRGKAVRIEGKGFGHGVGMCQWGARGMALAGKSYREILQHYYQGAELKRAY